MPACQATSEDLARLAADRILIDGAPAKGGGLLLQIFTQTVIGPIFFEDHPAPRQRGLRRRQFPRRCSNRSSSTRSARVLRHRENNGQELDSAAPGRGHRLAPGPRAAARGNL